MSQRTKKNYDLNAAIWAADSFFRLSRNLLDERIAKERRLVNVDLLGEVIASSTNLAFATELYLKALRISCELPPLDHHDLHALFKQLPPSTRAECIAKFDAIPGPDPAHTVSFGVYVSADRRFAESGAAPDTKPRPIDPIDNSLPAVLKRCKNAFAVWRYLYETAVHGQVVQHNYEFHFLGNAAMSIRKVLDDRHHVASG